MIPLIGIPCHIRDYNEQAKLQGVKESYIKALEACAAAVCLIPLKLSEDKLKTLYQKCDGILFAGGGDVDPALYGEKPHPSLDGVCRDRDTCEILLSRWCFEDKKPLLALCRGMQVLNVALGGKLYQDLPSQLPSKVSHRATDDLAHDLKLNPDSRLAGYLKMTEIKVNSRHHQALSTLSPQLRAIGVSADGVVEAVEAKGEQFLCGLQCHPEDLCFGPLPEWRRLFSQFVQACSDRS